MMKNLKLKTSHSVVLFAAIALTALSIIGSIAITDRIPTVSVQTTASGEESQQKKDPAASTAGAVDDSAYIGNSWIAKVDYSQKSFSSVVKPKLTECFNCGVVVGIEAVPANIAETKGNGLKAPSGDLSEQHLDNYLDAHSRYARLMVLDESNSKAHGSGQSRHHGEDIYANEKAYIVKVRMQNGLLLTVTLNTAPSQKIGDKVRIINERTITT
jgi:hypothetical protein